MTPPTIAPFPALFVSRVVYDLVRLIVTLASGDGKPLIEVTFMQPRAFRTYSESDYSHYLNEFEGRAIIQSTDHGCGVELSKEAPYLADYLAHVRLQEAEELFVCLIRTPDHCIEVICFEEPDIGRH